MFKKICFLIGTSALVHAGDFTMHIENQLDQPVIISKVTNNYSYLEDECIESREITRGETVDLHATVLLGRYYDHLNRKTPKDCLVFHIGQEDLTLSWEDKLNFTEIAHSVLYQLHVEGDDKQGYRIIFTKKDRK